MLPEIPLEQLCATLDEVAAEQLEISGIAEPPVDAFQLADAIGLTVGRDERLSNRARLVRLHVGAGHSHASILLAPEPRPERQHWAVAHEIGEHLAAEICFRLGISGSELPPAGREQLANQLANRILLPAEWFFPDAREQAWDLLSLKQLYSTASHELIARRMLDAAERAIISVYDQNTLTWRRSNAPGRLLPLSVPEIDTRRAAHEAGELSRRGDTIAWAIHEPDWKREIVRRALADFDDV